MTIALRANEEGYALLETFEVVGDSPEDEPTYGLLETVANQLDAQAFMVSGDVDLERLEKIAEKVRMVLRHA